MGKSPAKLMGVPLHDATSDPWRKGGGAQFCLASDDAINAAQNYGEIVQTASQLSSQQSLDRYTI